MKLLIFNPSHDEALASNSPYYYPSKAAQLQAERFAGQRFPWAKDGDVCWTPGDAVDWDAVTEIQPWGWDSLLRHQLVRAGAPERLLPSEEQIQRIRQLSSRQTVVTLLPLLRTDVAESFGKAQFCSSFEAVEHALQSWGEVVLKSPWSCSGRGVFRVNGLLTEAQQGRVRRILREQGGVEVEPFYAHEQDFAMEFSYCDGKLHYEGLNVFQTTPSGQYLSNLSPELLRVSPDVLAAVRQSLQQHLPLILGADYAGPLGIDMMQQAGKVHPCVEINLRRTMGQF